MEAYELLHYLGVTANYTGIFHMAYAVRLCAGQPERLMLVTKWVYADMEKSTRASHMLLCVLVCQDEWTAPYLRVF